jgi:type IV pilus assembly protein PilB
MELEGPMEDQIQDEFSAGDAPIIKLVNGILVKAVTDGVSDIHIEPFERRSRSGTGWTGRSTNP